MTTDEPTPSRTLLTIIVFVAVLSIGSVVFLRIGVELWSAMYWVLLTCVFIVLCYGLLFLLDRHGVTGALDADDPSTHANASADPDTKSDTTDDE